MKELIGSAMVFIVVGVSLIIGGAMIDKTANITAGIAPGGITATLATGVGSALTTFTSLLPILALALVGGLAIFYLLGFMGRGSGQ